MEPSGIPLLFYGVGLLVLAAVFGLSRNQGNLDFLMARRGHDFASLPARIRYYNIRLLAVLLVILCAAAIFIRPITSGCLTLLEIVKNLLGGLIGLLLSIFSSSGGESEAQQPQSTPTPTPILEGTSWAGWQILTFLIVLAAAVVLLFNLKKFCWLCSVFSGICWNVWLPCSAENSLAADMTGKASIM